VEQLGSSPQPQQLIIRSAEPSSVAAAAKMTAAKVVPARAAAGRELAPAPAVCARFNAPPPSDQVVAMNANAGTDAVPEFQTLVFIQATEYVSSNSSVWSIQVWRVTLVSAVGERMARVPVASSI
jgi:hypothetical protein